MEKRWHIHSPDPHPVDHIQKALGCHPVTAAVLVNRGFESESDAHDFLYPSLKRLRSPFELPDMDKGASRLARAIADREKIMIFGDYDVDGVTATSIMVEFIRMAGGNVSSYIPDRFAEGYGLQQRHIADVVIPSGATLVVTVDCGSSSIEAVRTARDSGIDMIITDHHEVPEPPPEAFALINPKRQRKDSAFHLLAGVGVSFSLIIATRSQLRKAGHWGNRPEPNLKQFCDLVAIGTIADLVPLLGENRIYVKTGIDIINSNRRPGLRALKEVAGVDADRLGPGDIAFRLVPRLNAAGRMDRADPAVDLLTTHDMEAAAQITRSLDRWNRVRKETEQRMLDEINRLLRQDPGLAERPGIILKNANWHEGVLGIVASRLAKEHGKPAFLLRESAGICKGSARSVPGFDLYQGLLAASCSLIQFGGHPMAAGLQLKSEHFERFREQLEIILRDKQSEYGFRPSLQADANLPLDQISSSLVDELDHLRPHGSGNPEPVFIADQVPVKKAVRVGGHHLRLQLMRGGPSAAESIAAIWFQAPADITEGDVIDQIAYHVRWNRWNGNKSLQIVILDIRRETDVDGVFGT